MNVNNAKHPVTISIEIKPKAGYLAYLHGFVTKGWFCSKEQQQSTGNANNNHEFRASNYSPLDVFSGDFTKLEAALLDLSMNVQTFVSGVIE
jgi:hypothetical protein